MSKKTPIHKLTPEELLSALENIQDNEKELIQNLAQLPKEDNSLTETDNVNIEEDFPILSFLEKFEIEEGKNSVPVSLLYLLFINSNKNSKLSMKQFGTQLRKYFATPHKVRGNRCFLLNKKALTLAKTFKKVKPNTRTKLRVTDANRHFAPIFKELKFKPGNLYVEGDILYHIYDTFLYKKHKNSKNYLKFISYCKTQFEYKVLDGTFIPWFKVDECIRDQISPQAVENWRNGRLKRYDKGKKTITEEKKKEAIYPETIKNKKEFI